MLSAESIAEAAGLEEEMNSTIYDLPMVSMVYNYEWDQTSEY